MKENTFTAIIFTLGVIAGFFVGLSMPDYHTRNDAISHGFAEYNSTNGQWQWKTNYRYEHIVFPTNFAVDANGGIWIKERTK